MSENEKLNRKLEEAHKSSALLSLGINPSSSSYSIGGKSIVILLDDSE